MSSLLKAEFIKLHHKKLVYLSLIIGLLPILFSVLFVSESEAMILYGTYGLMEYTSGMFGSLVLGTGILALYFALLINSFISDEVTSEIILYEVVGENKRAHTFAVKILTSVIVSLLFVIFSLLVTVISYFVFIRGSEYGQVADNIYELSSLLFAILYFIIFVVIIASLSFYGLQKILIFGAFVYNLVLVNLSNSELLFKYLLGAPIFTGVQIADKAMLRLEINQSVVIILTGGIIMALSRSSFLKRDL